MNEKVTNVLKQCKLLFVCCAIAVVIFIGNAIVNNTVYKQNLAEQSNQIQELTSKMEKNRVFINQTLNDAKSHVTGLDMDRVRTDDGIAEVFFKKIFTWSSAEDYTTIRNELMSREDVNSNFLTTVFPELKEEQDENGESANVIDDSDYGQLNMSYDSMISHVIGIDETTYSYFTEVTVLSEVEDGTSRIGNIVITYSVDKDGNVFDLNAYTVAE